MDVIDFGRYFAALLFVGALLGFAWLAARRYGLGGIIQPSAAKRLAVVESLMIAPKHKLVIVRRDERRASGADRAGTDDAHRKQQG